VVPAGPGGEENAAVPRQRFRYRPESGRAPEAGRPGHRYGVCLCFGSAR